jgi:hypothetical protein
MAGVMCVETMSVRVCGEGLMCAGAGADAGGDGTLSCRSCDCDVCWLECRSGSGVLLVERVWVSVVRRARRGRRKVGGKEHRVSERHCRAVRARSDIVVCVVCDCL